MKNSDQKRKLLQEANERIALGNAARELKKIQEEMERLSRAEDTSNVLIHPLQPVLRDLSTIGLSSEDIYANTVREMESFLQMVQEYAFSPALVELYFTNNKIVKLITILKSARMNVLAVTILNMFKERVKILHGNKLPTIKEKSGMFGKTSERAMKVEEIASRFEVEEDFPPDETPPLTPTGTKKGIITVLIEDLFYNEEVKDPTRRRARKSLAQFLIAAKLVNPNTNDVGEKQFLGCLLTPNVLQPRNTEDIDRLVKFTALLKMGRRWLEMKQKIKPVEQVRKTLN
ncbi:MAG: hypothetical protein ACOX5R_05485 [bacterium]|jgi:hypothetical protein